MGDVVRITAKADQQLAAELLAAEAAAQAERGAIWREVGRRAVIALVSIGALVGLVLVVR